MLLLHAIAKIYISVAVSDEANIYVVMAVAKSNIYICVVLTGSNTYFCVLL